MYVDFAAFILKRTVKGGLFALTCTHWKTGNLRRIASPLNFPILPADGHLYGHRQTIIVMEFRHHF